MEGIIYLEDTEFDHNFKLMDTCEYGLSLCELDQA